MNFDTIFGLIILIMWTVLVVMIGWNNKTNPARNIFISIEMVIVLGVIYWVPFWLIFLHGG